MFRAFLARDRWKFVLLAILFSGTAHAQFFGGGGGKQTDRATWNVCNGAPCVTGIDQTNHYVATAGAKVKKCYIAAKTPPTGAALTVDIRVNGTSIFGVQPLLSLPAGQTTTATVAAFDNPNVAEGDQLRIDVTAAGSIQPGQDVSVVCILKQN